MFIYEREGSMAGSKGDASVPVGVFILIKANKMAMADPVATQTTLPCADTYALCTHAASGP